MKRVHVKRAGCVAAAGVLSTGAFVTAQTGAEASPLSGDASIVTDVTVVDTETGALQRHRTVVIEGARIERISGHAPSRVPRSTTVVNGRGRYLVPGYLDMHTHSVPNEPDVSRDLRLLLANGVTGIREMAGSPTKIRVARQLNAQRAAGAADTPKVVQIPGPALAGLRAAEEGTRAVRDTKAMGGDFVKVVSVAPPALTAILLEAKAQNLTVAGHLSPALSAVDASKAGFRSIEHLGAGPTPVQLDCSTDQAAIRKALLSGQGARPPIPFPPTYTVSPFLYSAGDAPFLQHMMDTQDRGRCDVVARTLKAQGSWQVPTMIRLLQITRSDDAAFADNPNLKYVDVNTRAVWARLADEFADLEPSSARTTFRRLYPSYVKTLKILRANGGASRTLTGTDAGAIWNVPGFSLHDEFDQLAKAGFTPLEILRATTLNGARFLGKESSMGSVAKGKDADLVLLDRNPLTNHRNLSTIAGVFNHGDYLSKADLRQIKRQVAAEAAAVPPVPAGDEPITHSH